MKKKWLLVILIAVAMISSFALVGCGEKGDSGGVNPLLPDNPIPEPEPEYNVEVFANKSIVTINAIDLDSYDFTELFSIFVNGKSVSVEASYINTGDVPAQNGTGTVSCSYEGVSASVKVVIIATVYELNLKQSVVTVLESEAESYDYLSLFVATKDGVVEPLTADMAESNVSTAVGSYKYSVTYHGITKTLTVVVDNGITVTAYYETYELNDDQLFTYDYTNLFVVRKNGKYLPIGEEYFDIDVTLDGGKVTCSYMGKSATVRIVAKPLNYRLVKLRDSLTVHSGKAVDYDFTKLFIAYINGVKTPLTASNVTTDITDVPGEYTVTINFWRVSETLPVTVTSGHIVEIIPAYSEIVIAEDKVATVNLADYFWLYVDEELCDSATISFDKDNLLTAVSGDVVSITATYAIGDTTKSNEFNVRVTEKTAPIVTAKNVVTYPNGEMVDTKSLFDITVDGADVPVTSDMISGTIDYLTEGIYDITLTYDGRTYVATVEVRSGVTIEVVNDTTYVTVGTDKAIYDFAKDFIVIVNGVRYRRIERYIDATQADFNVAGEYDVTITIPYVTKQNVVNNVVCTAKYKVVKNSYEVNIISPDVHLGMGATSYDVTTNLDVSVNGIRQGFTDNPDWADVLTLYYTELSEPVDFTVSGVKEVRLALYVDGVGESPVEVSYNLVVYANISVIGTDIAVFTGTTIMPEDMFAVTENGETVYPKFGNINGKVNVFVPGVYYVSIDYKGITAESRVVIIDNAIKGVYHTTMTTIPVEQEYDEEGDVVQDAVPAKVFGDFVVREDGSIGFGNRSVTIIGAVDERTILLRIGANDYTLYYDNGIVVLDPDNSLKLGFTDNKRPLVYFNEDVWTIDSSIIVNRGANYVIGSSTTTYSIDVFKIISASDANVSRYYGLKVHLATKFSSDWVYSVSYGDVTFAEGFTAVKGESSSLVFDGDTYYFVMLTDSTAKVDANAGSVANYKYARAKFDGTVDGKNASLKFDNSEKITLQVGSNNLFTATQVANMRKNAYIDYDTDTVFVYDFNENIGKYFSYRIRLNTAENKFTVDPKDSLFGYYRYSNMYIFLDGYGGGHIAFDDTVTEPLQITYSRLGNEVEINYVGVSENYQYGTSATFYLAELLNVLTCKDVWDDALVGARFTNKVIIDGAIILLKNESVNSGTRKDALLAEITVITKDGEWSATQKESDIDLTAISINVGAFYRFVVKNLSVEGRSVNASYVVEYRSKPYVKPNEGYELATAYEKGKSGLCDSSTKLTINKWGVATIEYNKVTYTGDAFLNADGTFEIKAYSDNYDYIAAKGETIADGIVKVVASGADKFTEYFTTGTVRVVGCGGQCLIREIVVNSVTKYYISTGIGSLGSEASITCLSGTSVNDVGTIFNAESADMNVYAKVCKWGDSTDGLVVADAVRGTYTCATEPDLTLDGFGTATYGEDNGIYVINVRRTVTVVVGDETKVYALNADGTYKPIGIALDNTLLEGRRFVAEYAFYCDNEPYTALTTFIFGKNGVVTVKSTSSEHDNGSDSKDMCQIDKYDPSFASKDGVTGTYSVNGIEVTVTVNGETFVFGIVDVVVCNKMTVKATTVSSDAHGYFGIGKVFAS